MVVNGFWYVFLLGCFGGFIGEILHWFRLRESSNLPHYAKSLFYWVITLSMILVGGVLAPLYGIGNVNAILAVHIGLSAPLIISGMASTTPTGGKRGVSGIEQRPSILKFLAGS